MIVALDVTGSPAAAQSIPAVRGLSAGFPESTDDSIRIHARGRREHYIRTLRADRTPDGDRGRALAELANLAADVEASRSHEELVMRFEHLTRRERELADSLGGPDLARAPIIRSYFPEVLFTIGSDVTFGDHATVTEFAIGTNAAGAAAAKVFDVLGIDALKDYAKNNLSLGVSFPGEPGAGVSSQVGLGLGLFRFAKALDIAPMLALEQIDDDDPRVPRPVARGKPSQGTWSTPYVGVTVMWLSRDEMRKRVLARQFVPFVSVGAGLPYFFPGDALTGLGAIFTDRRRDYARAGEARFVLAVDFPILPAGR